MDYLPSEVLPLRVGRTPRPRQLDGESEGKTLPDHSHDLLSFLSAVLNTIQVFDGTLALLQVLLSSERYTSIADGSYFQIAILPAREVYRWVQESDIALVFGDEDKKTTSELLAVKSPIQGRGKDNTTWSAMTREIRILRDGHLRQHQNIVRLLGVCWQASSGGVPMPALILEAAEMDLDKYFVGGRATTLEKILDLAIDVASGIEAVHDVGVIHGDIKPQNILVFQAGENQWKAKIADFGSSLICAEVRGKVPVQFVSRFWAAPETVRPLTVQELQQADLFSLGMVLWKILGLGGLITDLEQLAGTQDEIVVSAILEQLKKSGDLARVAHASVKKRHYRSFQPPSDYTEAVHMADTVSMALGPPSRRKDASFYVANFSWIHMAACGRATEKLTSVLLYCGAESLKPPPKTIQAAEEGNGIPSISNQYSTIFTLPRTLHEHIIQRIKEAALHANNEKKSLDAGFEYAMYILDSIQVCQQTQDTLDEALDFLLKAAIGNISIARSIVGWLFAAFGKVLPRTVQIQEPDWLLYCIEAGSDTAQSRYKALNLPDDRYQKAMNRLRLSRYEFHLDFVVNELRKGFHTELSPGKLPSLNDYMPSDDQALLRFTAMTGNHTALEALLSSEPNLDLNVKDNQCVTSLMMACIEGHAEVAERLLRHGADPKVTAINGTTPLHFLTSFEDKHIPRLADELVQAGALLEARATAAKFGPGTISNSYLRIAKGTPLAFAVAANNLVAVQSLLKHGADPFDELSEKEEPSDKIGSLIHHSPVLLATVYYQHDILKSLLIGSSRAFVKDYLAPKLINVGSRRKAVLEASMLQWVVNFDADGLRRRILLHGAQFREAFAKTFEILVEYGADPMNADGKGASIAELAILRGQPFIIDYFTRWQDAKLMKGPKIWLQCLKRAAEFRDSIMFDTLMRYQNIPEALNTDLWLEYFESACKAWDEIRFLEPFESKMGPNFDGTDLLWGSLLAGNFSVARWIYERTKCDFNRRENGSTLFGTLLFRSKTHSHLRKAVEVLISLPNLPEDIFYDVVSFNESSLTALQAAVYFPEYNAAASVAGRTLQTILERWPDPKYLNFQVPNGYFQGSTALHMAIRTANRTAVDHLLDETEYLDDLDLKLLDSKGYNVYDRAIINLSSQDAMLEHMQLPEIFRERADLDHWTRSFIILTKLEKVAPRPNRIIRAYVRHEVEMCMLLTFHPKLEVERFKVDGGIWSPRIIELAQMFRIFSELKVDEAKFEVRALSGGKSDADVDQLTKRVADI